MRIAITGASGFMGGVLARTLAVRGHAVFGYGRRHAGAIVDPIVNYTQWDLTDGPIEVPAVDAVVHCAALVGDWGREVDYRRVNVDGTRAVLEMFAAADRFIHISSASVYSSDQPTRHLTETASVGNGLYTAYARTKADAEAMVRSRARRAIILRPHIVYGPGDTTLMPRLLAARRFGWLAVPGDGRNRISVTHILNFVHAVECALQDSAPAGAYNIADLEPVCVDQLLRALLPRDGVGTRLLHVPRSLAWTTAALGEGVWRLGRRSQAPRLTRYLVTQIADGHTLELSRACGLLGYAPKYTYRDAAVQVNMTQ